MTGAPSAQFDPDRAAAQLRQTTRVAEALTLIEPLPFTDLKRVCKRFGVRYGDVTRLNDLRHRLINHLLDRSR